MYKTISDLCKKSGWNARVSKFEYSDELKSKFQVLREQDHSNWYYVDFYRTDDYTRGIRIEGTKEELQEIVDMLNVAIHSTEKE